MGVKSGERKPFCVECEDTVPESVLWDVAEFEEDPSVHDVKLPGGAESYNWFVIDRMEKAKNETCIEIFVHDASDEQAVREARNCAKNNF